MYDKKVSAGELDADLFLETASGLWQATQDGWGSQLGALAYESPGAELLRQMRSNLYVFAAFKNHAHTADLVSLLTDPATGELRSWPEFRDMAKPITGQYYEEWLRAEYETAVASGQMAKKWQDFERNADILPMLTYKTQKDARVRPAHAVLDETTLPINDPFWDTYYPPNGWRCRCNVIQTAGPERRNDLEPSEEQTPVAFRNNPGKTGLVFSEQHPYFDTATPRTKRRILAAMRALLVQEDIYDQVYTSPAGSRVTQHITHNTPAAAQHRATGKALADGGISAKLMPIDFRPGAVNHTAEIEGKPARFVQPLGTYNSIKKALDLATDWAVIVLTENAKRGDLVRAIRQATHLRVGVIVIWKGQVRVIGAGQDPDSALPK